MQIEIINVGQPTSHTKGKNTWEMIEVAYKKDGEVKGKKLVSFVYTEVFKAFKGYKQGDVVEVTSVKEGDNWQWTNVERATANTSGGSVNSPSGQNNENVSESIKRQCAAKVAGALLSGVAAQADLFFTTADFVLSYINNKHKKDVFADFENDIPQ